MKTQEAFDKELSDMRSRARARIAEKASQGRSKRVEDWDAFLDSIRSDLDLGERFRETVARWRREE